MTKIIGLTGGIGSGKTTVANYFASIGIPVYIADNHAKSIMTAATIQEEIKKKIGESVFNKGVLDRAKLAQIVFNDASKLQLLNNIVHPAVKKHFEQWLLKHISEAYVVYEAAILFESGSYKMCNVIISVSVPIEERVKRVIARDSVTKEQVLKRISMQMTDEERNSKSDFVIVNTSFDQTKLEIVKILKLLKIKQN
jgi:dephospho-CoA kinase